MLLSSIIKILFYHLTISQLYFLLLLLLPPESLHKPCQPQLTLTPLFVQHFTNYVEYILLEFLNSKQFAKGYERMIREIFRKSGYFIIK